MKRNNQRMLISIVYIILGIGLSVAVHVAQLDSFWSGMGFALIFVGIIGIARWIKYAHNEEYRYKMDVEAKDERNRYISMKAWAWAGYLFIMIAAVSCILLKIAGFDEYSLIASSCICIVLILYWVSYAILRRKY